MHDVPRRMPFPADPAETPDSLVVLAWNWFTLRMGIDLLVTLRPRNRRGWDDYSPRSGNPMLAKRFVRRSVRASHNAASARSLRLAVRTRGRTEQILAKPRAISAGHQQVRRPQASATGISYYYIGWMEKVTHRPALVPDRNTSRDCHTQFLSVDVSSSCSQ